MSTANQSSSAVSKPLMITLGVVVLAALGYLAITLLGGDAAGDGPVAAGSEPGSAGASEVPGTTVGGLEPSDEASESPSEVAAVEPAFEVFDARDPFDQLVAEDTNPGGEAVGDTQLTSTGAAPVEAPPPDLTDPTTTDPTTIDPTTTDPTTGTPTVDDPTTTGAPKRSQTTVEGTTIMLDDVYITGGDEIAVVVVDAEGYEAREGETAGGKVEVLDIAGNCATMRYNDNRFILCEGEQIRK